MNLGHVLLPAALPALLLALGGPLDLKTTGCEDPPPVCDDIDGDGYGDGEDCAGPDCDDLAPAVNPGAQEACENGVDDDCDGAADLADLTCGCTDADGDGWGEGPGCLGPDCDDAQNRLNPGRTERCADGLDNDCDGAADGADDACADPDGPLELYPNLETVGVGYALGALTDPEGDARASFTWRLLPDGAPRAGWPPSYVPETNRFSGAVVDLAPGQAIAVDLTLADPTTPALNLTAHGEASTRAAPAAPTPVASWVVAPDGVGQACTAAVPCALATALARVRAGEEVVMRGGTYRVGGLALTRSGTAEAPIVIRSADGERAVWDGFDGLLHAFSPVSGYPGVYVTDVAEASANANVVIADGVRLYPYRDLGDLSTKTISCILATPQAAGVAGFWRDPRPTTTVPAASPNPYYRKIYVHLDGGADPGDHAVEITAQATGLDLAGQEHILLKDLTFRGYGRSPSAWTIRILDSDHVTIDGCAFEWNDRAIVLDGTTTDVVVQGSTFLDNTAWDTYLGKATYEPETPQACYGSYPPPYPWNDRLVETGGLLYGHGYGGRGLVIRDSTFTGFMDGFKASPPSVAAGFTTAEVDIARNTVVAGDDGFEVDGYAANVRVWGNTLWGCADGISLAPPAHGPVYLWRNTFTGGRTSHATIEGYSTLQEFYGQPIKLDCPCEGGEVFLFHNTVYHQGIAWGLRLFEPTVLRGLVARNNVIVSEDAWALNVLTHEPGLPPYDLDYDLYFNATDRASISIYGQPIPYATLGEVTAAYGWEPHGLEGDPRLVDPDGGDLRLGPGSPAIDAGVILPGFNEGYAGAGPDLGAWEGE